MLWKYKIQKLPPFQSQKIICYKDLLVLKWFVTMMKYVGEGLDLNEIPGSFFKSKNS